MITPESLDLLLPGPPAPRDSWAWATVTQVSPLRVRMDGEASALGITPDLRGGTVAVGDRVWCQRSGGRLVAFAGVTTAVDRGLQTLTTPTTSVQTTPAIPFGTTFAAMPNVVVGQAISSGGVVVHTYAISVSASSFAIRYVASAAFGSSPTVHWIASGDAA